MRMERTYLIRTFGCQMNEHDSERIGGLLMADGMTPTDDPAEARVIVFNTCAIRENADNKLYGNLGHLKPLKDRNPELRIVVAGCLAQKDQGLIQEKAPWVDVVVGTHALPQLLDLLRRAEVDGPADGRPRVHGGLPERPAGRARRRLPGLGLDLPGLRQRVHVLHRAARPGAATLAIDRRHPGGGPGSGAHGGRRGDAARAEREHLRPRRDRAGVLPQAAVRGAAA